MLHFGILEAWPSLYAQIDMKNATIKIQDGTAVTPLEITVGIGEGNLTFTEKRTLEYILDRGTLDDVREADEEPVDVSIDAKWTYIMSDSTDEAGIPSVREALSKTGQASAWVSTDSDACRPFAVDLVIEHVPSCAGSLTKPNETITLPDFRYEQIAFDTKAGTLAITGKCNVTAITALREAAA